MQHLSTPPPATSADAGDELKPDAPPTPSDAPAPARKRRGFAVMDPKLVAEISRKGGKAAHSAGTAHEFTSDEARAAGRKGGLASHAKRKRAAEASPKPSSDR
jgi:general stress protein YciG